MSFGPRYPAHLLVSLSVSLICCLELPHRIVNLVNLAREADEKPILFKLFPETAVTILEIGYCRIGFKIQNNIPLRL